jgi:hypothetical protein
VLDCYGSGVIAVLEVITILMEKIKQIEAICVQRLQESGLEGVESMDLMSQTDTYSSVPFHYFDMLSGSGSGGFVPVQGCL